MWRKIHKALQRKTYISLICLIEHNISTIYLDSKQKFLKSILCFLPISKTQLQHECVIYHIKLSIAIKWQLIIYEIIFYNFLENLLYLLNRINCLQTPNELMKVVFENWPHDCLSLQSQSYSMSFNVITLAYLVCGRLHCSSDLPLPE